MTDTTTLPLTGEMLVAGEFVRGAEGELFAFDPSTGERLEPAFGVGGTAEVDAAAAAAEAAFPAFAAMSPDARAAFLDLVADRLDAARDELVARAHAETGLPVARLTGEVGRTTGQLRMFAGVLREGSASGVRIDPAQPDRAPLPRADIRQRKVPLGPVAVFGASNFPFAFSNAGGDTAAAFAAGCPVIVKVHNAHLGTAMLVSAAIAGAVADSGLPGGVYSALIGGGATIGQALVTHPVVQAVGFTGSRSGGTALVAAAAGRPVPIPVYAEMSSINPVFVFPSQLTDATASGFVGSLTLGSGQFCTNPGLVFVPRGEAGDAFVASVGAKIAEATGQTMLTEGIRTAFTSVEAKLAASDGVREVGRGTAGDGPNAPAPSVLETDAAALVANPELQSEMFGASSMFVRYDTTAELLDAAARIEGQLTATIQATEAEYDEVRELLPVLERKVGRILFGGWPTGVEVGHAMVHGGPFPATSDSRTTSVGSLAIERFQRPVAYQDLPDALLPEVLQQANPWHQVRRIDGRIEGL